MYTEEHINVLVQELRKINFIQSFDDFGKKLQNQAKYLWDFFKMFEAVLLVQRATRQSLWELHLESLEKCIKYFMVFDQIYYARLSPVYISQMYHLKEKDPSMWQFLQNGNFSVNKTGIPFTAIDADHSLEQENRSMKISGGIQGRGNKHDNLDQYFLIDPVRDQILREFTDNFLVTKKERTKH